MARALGENEMYRRLHRGNPGDVGFYQRVAQQAHSVLELGSGWGRISLPLAAAGHEVVGLDDNIEFIASARRSARAIRATPSEDATPTPVFIEGDMRRFSLDRTFDRVLIPYNALYALGGIQGVRACFRCVRQHLSEHGELWFDVYPIDRFHELATMDEVPPDEPEEVAVWDVAGQSATVYETTELSPDQQRLVVHYDAVDPTGHHLGRHTSCHDYLLTEQILDELNRAEMEALTISSTFVLDSAEKGSPGPQDYEDQHRGQEEPACEEGQGCEEQYGDEEGDGEHRIFGACPV